MEKQTAALGAGHDYRLYAATTLGLALSALGRHAEAEMLLRDTHARFARTLGAEHQYALRASSALGHALVAQGGRAAVDEGLALLRAAHARQAALFPDHVVTRRTAARLAGAGGP